MYGLLYMTIYHLLKSVMLSPLSATYLRILILILILLKNFFITPSSREHLRSVSSSAEFLFLNHFKLVSSNFHIHRGSSYFGNFVTFQEGDVWMYNLHNNQSHFVISIKISQFRAKERWKEWGFLSPGLLSHYGPGHHDYTDTNMALSKVKMKSTFVFKFC